MPKGYAKILLEKENPYFWCTCGLSSNEPFCDGTHKGSGKKALSFQVEKTGDFFLCGCKKTKTPPYCDGSHKL